jgi:predicted RNA binding protein YcfA (HicA-like mRNA interferase family)
MVKKEKLLEKIKTNPKNVRFEELCKALKDRGYDIINKKGSHYSFSNGQKTLTIVKPHGGNKFCHVLDVKEIIKQCLQ